MTNTEEAYRLMLTEYPDLLTAEHEELSIGSPQFCSLSVQHKKGTV